MNLKTLKRYWMMLRLISIGGGYSRAEYLKKKHYFKSIGEHVYLQPWNFGTEPELISFGDNVIIGAGSLVNKSIPSGTVAAGVPCKVIGSFEEYQRKMVKDEFK